jgi:hypothetical protein
MAENVGGIYYEVDADTSGLLRAEKEVDQSTRKVEDRLKKSTSATDKQGESFGKLNPITRAVRQETDRLSGSVQRAGQGFRRAHAMAAGFAALLAGLATGAMVQFVRTSLDAVDAQAKLAAQLDATIGGLRGLQLAGNDAGVSTGAMNSAIERLNMTLGQAERGAGTAGDALDRLGLSARELTQMDVDERMAAIADRIQAMGLSGAQTADVLRQLGIRQRELVNLMRNGGDAIRAATQEIEDYGLAIEAVDAATIEAANDALSRVGMVMESIRQQVAVQVAPIILELADNFNSAAREAGGWGSVVSIASEQAVTSVAKVADTFHNVRVAVKQGDVAIANMELGFARFAEGAWRSVGRFLDSWAEGLNNIISILNRIPGMGGIEQVGSFTSGGFMQGIIDQADIARGRFNLLQMELNELANQELPSDKIEEFFERVERRRQEMIDSIDRDGGILGDLGLDEDGASGASAAAGQVENSIDDLSGAYDRLLDRLFPIQAAQRQFKEEQMLLSAAFMQGRIDVDEYREALQRLEEQARNTGDVWDSYDLFRGDVGDQDQSFWEQWLEGAENAFTNFDEMAANTADRFTSAFGSAFERMIFDSQSAGDAFRGLADTMLRSVVRSLGEMAAQWVAYHAVQMALGRTSEAAAIAGAAVTGSSIAAAYAPAAAMASLASFGANAAPAMAGISSTVATAQGLAMVGMAHDGIDNVPREGTWLLDKGERVVGADLNRDLGNFLERQGNGGGGHQGAQPAPVFVNVINNSPASVDVQERTGDDGSRQIEVLVSDIMGDGQVSRAIRNKFGLSPRGR